MSDLTEYDPYMTRPVVGPIRLVTVSRDDYVSLWALLSPEERWSSDELRMGGFDNLYNPFLREWWTPNEIKISDYRRMHAVVR